MCGQRGIASLTLGAVVERVLHGSELRVFDGLSWLLLWDSFTYMYLPLLSRAWAPTTHYLPLIVY